MTADPLVTRAARHLALPQIGERGQKRIAASSVLLIGIGGIGCATATYLACAGVGHLVVVDFDTVDATNLGRQTLYGPNDIGQLKASCASATLREINPDIEITAVTERLDGNSLSGAVKSADVVVDGCDNFTTRFAINDACVQHSRYLISASAIRFEGQIAVFGPDYRASPCYRCLYTEADESLENCSGAGVLSPVPGVMGAIGAAEVIKRVAGLDDGNGRLTLYDAASAEWRSVDVPKRRDCPSCGHVT